MPRRVRYAASPLLGWPLSFSVVVFHRWALSKTKEEHQQVMVTNVTKLQRSSTTGDFAHRD